ncbi:HhH-GPD family base excision DNA repair protein (macronuclear) [Tetrahymena thermophila SB210]|uniref:DNA-(apurinic or apyrimidinic site) lyase n=1 Tax=Tetrahymena thermophila (strain SB210) TaxID=312017 RepID=Q24BS7_TETTS|nr:HhH-GPD family base excision DNA repair protein [Tetrahymena thermophila SB210]EAS05231.2 HhH-GPD family base excision DNA repair protein [Tetrahymena thermophila SB210]|eukprot:XP_001025476.2 HhH-GPD family base excision DNA repair protein [Tetrahymena thermophila SB210]
MKSLINPLTKKPITQIEFNLKNTLVNGQAFNWINKDVTYNKEFRGILGKNVVDFKVNENNEVMYKEIPENSKIEEIINDYLQLNVDLVKLTVEWSEKDNYYAKVKEQLKGVRILRQFPFECMISFICSQNNNIPRITKILKSLRQNFGEEIYREKLEDGSEEIYYSFPSVASLRKATEQNLRDLGLGYRANYIVSAVQLLEEKGGEEYLHKLRQLKDSHEKREALLEFKGIGNKVADCISLFSLDAKDLIPVDTHVFQIYNRVYKKNKNKDKKMTKDQYSEIENFFKDLYGDYAGWAHQAIFAAELVSFQSEINSNENSSVKKTKSSKLQEEKEQEKEQTTEEQKIISKSKISEQTSSEKNKRNQNKKIK